MIEAKTKQGTTVYVSLCDDVDPNKGGYFCQVYSDEDMQEELDYFCIHPEDLECASVEELVREYVKNELQ